MRVQGFLKGDDTCEIEGIVVALKYHHGIVELTTRDDTGYVVTHVIPYGNLSMLRIYKK